MDQPIAAIFIDVDNLAQWVKEGGVVTLLSALTASPENVRVRKAYGIWSHSHIHHLQEPLNNLGFDLVHSYHPVSGKNSADIQMTIDVMEIALTRGDIDKIVLATGDSDFSPLFRRLRDMGKSVIGVGAPSVLSEAVKHCCSEYIYTNTPETTSANSGSSKGAPASTVAKGNNISRVTLKKVIKGVRQELARRSQPVHLSALKNKLIADLGLFQESDWGYSSFLAFMQSIEGINVFQEEGHTYWLCSIDYNPTSKPIDLAPYMSAAAAEPYKRLLKKINWPFAELRVLQYLHRTLPGLPSMHFLELKEHLFERLGLASEDALASLAANDPCTYRVDKTAIRKGCSIMLRAGLFQQDQEGRITYIDREDYLEKINDAITARIKGLCEQNEIPYERRDASWLLYPVEDNDENKEPANKQSICTAH